MSFMHSTRVEILIAPSPGAFGSGATFGMEDGWVLAQALELEHSRGSESLVRDALQIFEEIRLPYYQRM
jgi:salicylate hydroxylase